MLFITFFPILLFIFLYTGIGLYFSSFYIISPLFLIIPCISLAIYQKGNGYEKFLTGLQNKDILGMCIIFLLSGAFSVITANIGSVDSIVNFLLSCIDQKYILISIFFTSAFISTAIGTSMGTIATVSPIVNQMITMGVIPGVLGIATVISGAIFGDNLSLISDTTIAAVKSQDADANKKFLLNSKIALVAGFIMIVLLFNIAVKSIQVVQYDYNFILIIPYLVIFISSFLQIHIFKGLFLGICSATIIGIFYSDYSILLLSNDISKGFLGMFEISVLSLAIGGLSVLLEDGVHELTLKIESSIEKMKHIKKGAMCIIAFVVSLFDVLLANNTIAIILSGGIAKKISVRFRLDSAKVATILDIFSCIFQGVIPYGAQVLLASSITGISPLLICSKVYYCYILFIVMVGYLGFSKD